MGGTSLVQKGKNIRRDRERAARYLRSTVTYPTGSKGRWDGTQRMETLSLTSSVSRIFLLGREDTRSQKGSHVTLLSSMEWVWYSHGVRV